MQTNDSVNNELKIPDNWVVIKLSEVCEKIETVKRKGMNNNEEFIYLDIGGIDNKTNKIASYKKYQWQNAPSRAQQIIFINDILFSTVRTYLKNIALVNDKIFDGQVASSGFCVIRGNQNIVNGKYLFYYSISQRFLEPLNDLQTGSSYPAVRDNDVFSQLIFLPPLTEQSRIVAKIEELFSSLDKGIESLKTALQQLKVYRQAVLKYAFEGKLTNGEMKWNHSTLGDIISISSGEGLSKSKRNDEGEYLVYGGNGITGRHSEFIYEDEKLIIGRVGAHCGNVHITKPKSWITDNAFVVSFDEIKIEKKFLYYLVLVLNLNKYSSSTAQPVISQGKLYPIAISIPERKDDQWYVVREIEFRLSVCDKIEESINQGLQQAESLRQSILKKAFEGKLVPQDLTDKPASKLLERIKAEKEKIIKEHVGEESKRRISRNGGE